MRLGKRGIKLNKKGVGAEYWLEQIPYILLTVAVMGGVFLLVNTFVNLSVDVKPLQREVFFSRIMYAPNSIIYTDNVTGIVYPGVIDFERFTNDTLDSSIKYSYERHIAAKLELYSSRKELVRTAYLNSVWFNRMEPLARNWVKGAGGAKMYRKSIPVVYRINNVNRPGFLKIEMIMPN